MSVVVGFVRTREGRAALRRAVEEARLRDTELLVVHSMRGGERDEVEHVVTYREEFEHLEQQLSEEGIRFRLVDYVRGNSPAEDLMQVASEEDATLLVIGMRRRSAFGTLVLGSNAHDILLEAPCPVLAVRPDDE